MTKLMARKASVSPYRACLYAIGAGVHAVPALLMRFQDEKIVQHDMSWLAPTVPKKDGGFNYADIPYHADFATFEAEAIRIIDAAAVSDDLGETEDPFAAVTFLSCLPWMDYTSINNALRDKDDCTPRVSWGKIVDESGRSRMSMTLEVHHALVDGADVGAYFEKVQNVLDTF